MKANNFHFILQMSLNVVAIPHANSDFKLFTLGLNLMT